MRRVVFSVRDFDAKVTVDLSEELFQEIKKTGLPLKTALREFANTLMRLAHATEKDVGN